MLLAVVCGVLSTVAGHDAHDRAPWLARAVAFFAYAAALAGWGDQIR